MPDRTLLGGVSTAATVVALLCGCADRHASVDAPAKAGSTPFTLPTTVAPKSALPQTSKPPTAAPEPVAPRAGRKQETDLGEATVYSVKFPVRAQDSTAMDIRTKGTQFAIVDIKVCANGSVDADGYGFDASSFQLVDTESRSFEFWNVQVGARDPNLTYTVSGVDTPRAGSCVRGWLTFELPPKTKIASVEYRPSGGGTPLTWTI
jgi:hypothetical protein